MLLVARSLSLSLSLALSPGDLRFVQLAGDGFYFRFGRVPFLVGRFNG